MMLTDQQILALAEPFGEFHYGDAQGHKRLAFARAVIVACAGRQALLESKPLRDEFAMEAFKSMLNGRWPDLAGQKEAAKVAYAMADAMLQARNESFPADAPRNPMPAHEARLLYTVCHRDIDRDITESIFRQIVRLVEGWHNILDES